MSNKTSMQELLRSAEVQSELTFHQACFAMYAGDKVEAQRLFEESLKLSPNNENARQALEGLLK